MTQGSGSQHQYSCNETADDLELGVAFGDAAGDVVLGARVDAHAGDHDQVQRRVGLPVAAPVEAVALGLAGGGGQWGGGAQHREGGFAAQPLGVVAGGDQQLPGGLHADPGRGHELRGELADEGGDELVEVGDLVVEVENAAGGGAGRGGAGGGGGGGGGGGRGAWQKPLVSGRQVAQVRISCMRVRLRTWSRSSSGAATMWLPSSCSAARRLLTAGVRVSRSTRSASPLPSLVLGVLVRRPARAARAAFSASRVSFLPRRRRSERSGRSTSATSIPASPRWRVIPAPYLAVPCVPTTQ